MPSIATLAPRANQLVYEDTVVQEVADLLATIKYPQVVLIDEEIVDSETKARHRAMVMRTALSRLDPPVKARAHTVGPDDNGKWRAGVSPGAVPRTKKSDTNGDAPADAPADNPAPTKRGK